MSRERLSAPIRQDAPTDAESILNVAATCPATQALGPGTRAVVWVQGCVFQCPGCIAPDWIPIRPARLVSPEILVNELLADPQVTGLTFSGGEPVVQAAALAHLARLARARRALDIICFTGFQRAFLEHTPPFPGVTELLDQVDVLVDGPYIARLNDNHGLRGSKNQKIHYLTDRLRGTDLENQPRRAEVHLLHGQAMLVGVPPLQLGDAFNRAVDRAQALEMELLHYERV